ncbi:hypothetical protein AGMMS49991_00900 [Spirochaetia bacterium]|nr:hypothetical protein AGMMS49991_00900 [Spirochaetia bacterium]
MLPLYAKAQQEETKILPLNAEWVFCVTSFDTSALPPARRIIGEVLAANLVNSLSTVGYRIRVSPEYAWYESSAWLRSRADAGKRISAKRDTRDQLLFQGYPAWRYKRDLTRIDKELVKLEEDYRTAEANIPVIETRPVFKMTADNYRDVFPQPPEAGQEYRFCLNQKADAFLAGQITEYHNRIYIVLRVYALYTRSIIYEDSMLFSPEDINMAVDELSGRLVTAIEGTPPAAIVVKAAPENAVISINRDFAGRGSTAVIEREPAEVEVSVSAPDYITQTVTVNLNAGELSNLSFNLLPLASSLFQVQDPLNPGSAVYLGALYVGQTPLSLELPLHHSDYITVEAPNGAVGSTIIPREIQNTSVVLSVPSTMPLEKGRVNKSRRKFYGAWGRFWIALPVAMLVSGISGSLVDANNRMGGVLYTEAVVFQGIQWGAIGVAAGFGVEAIIRAILYAHQSGKGEPSLKKGL